MTSKKMTEIFTLLNNCKVTINERKTILLEKWLYYCVVKLIWLLSIAYLSLNTNKNQKRSNNELKNTLGNKNKSLLYFLRVSLVEAFQTKYFFTFSTLRIDSFCFGNSFFSTAILGHSSITAIASSSVYFYYYQLLSTFCCFLLP